MRWLREVRWDVGFGRSWTFFAAPEVRVHPKGGLRGAGATFAGTTFAGATFESVTRLTCPR